MPALATFFTWITARLGFAAASGPVVEFLVLWFGRILSFFVWKAVIGLAFTAVGFVAGYFLVGYLLPDWLSTNFFLKLYNDLPLKVRYFLQLFQIPTFIEATFTALGLSFFWSLIPNSVFYGGLANYLTSGGHTAAPPTTPPPVPTSASLTPAQK